MKDYSAALAINGGEKAVKEPFPPRGHFTAEERDACVAVLDRAIEKGSAPGYGGQEEDAFCAEFSEMLGGGCCDAVSSGTAAVFVALRALDLEPFTEVIVPPVTDVGGFTPVVMANCVPVVADAEPGSFNISLEGIKKVCTERTGAIIAAHIAGEPCDIERIFAFARENNIKLIEDCAQAHGAKLGGKPVGTFGDIGAFSMMFGKHTCMGGQGGAVFTRDEELYKKIRQNSDRGKPFGLPPGSTNCVAALNFNADELHCAIGRVQIRKTEKIASGRREVVRKLLESLVHIPAVKPPRLSEGAEPSYWFLRLMFDSSAVSCDKQAFCDALNAEGVGCVSWYQATPYLYDWYTKRHVFGKSGYPWSAPEYRGDRDKVYSLSDLPNAAKALKDTVIIYPNESWTDENIAQCARAFEKVYLAYRY